MAYKIRYKNHCTPQEQIASGGRYYLDSDCGRKLTGDCEVTSTLSGSGVYSAETTITTSPSSAITSKNFLFIKNTGSNDVVVTLDGTNYYILLSENESFTSEVSASSSIRAKTLTGTSTIEYFVQT